MQLRIKKVGNPAGVILPRELLDHLGLGIGDAVSVGKTRRGIELSPSEAGFKAQMAIAREVMTRRKRALRQLGNLSKT